MINLFVTDDHPIVLEGIKNLLHENEDIRITGCFRNAGDTLEALRQDQPDVMLLDINLPGMGGLELCRQVIRRYGNIKIIALSLHNERPVIDSMLECGASGYVLKNAIGAEIIEAIHAVMKGQRFLCAQTREVVRSKPAGGLKTIPRITRREKEILQQVARGLTTAQTAEALFISVHTVESHRKNLMDKFQANSMPSVIKMAMEFGLL